jgi:hypothetical protein
MRHCLLAFLPAFAGVNISQPLFTGFCPAAMVFKKLGSAAL